MLTDGVIEAIENEDGTVESLLLVGIDITSRRRTEEALTCTCDACTSVTGLDLKFVLHHGTYVAQSIAGSSRIAPQPPRAKTIASTSSRAASSSSLITMPSISNGRSSRCSMIPAW